MKTDEVSVAMARARQAQKPNDRDYPIELRDELAEQCFQLIEAGHGVRDASLKIASQSAVFVLGTQVLRWVRQRYPVDAILYAQRRTAVSIATAIGKSFGLAEQRAMNTMMLRELNRRIRIETGKRHTDPASLNVLSLMAKRLIEVDTLLDKRGAALDGGLFADGVSEDDALAGAELMEEVKGQALVNFEQTKKRLTMASRVRQDVETQGRA